MIRIISILTLLPLVACSQNDLGFWEGTPEQEKGCKLWTLQTNNCEFCSSYVTYTDCYGNAKEYRAVDGFVMNGSAYTLCSMDRPVAMQNTPPSRGIASITQTGWCTDPIGSVWDFWLEGVGLITNPFPALMSEVYIYSADAGGTNRNLIYSTTTPQNIVGSDNAVTVNDTFTGQEYYVVRVRARRDGGIGINASANIRPGFGPRMTFSSTSFEYKEVIMEKREFYIQFGQG